MEFKVLNWNIGGAKFLQTPARPDRERIRKDLNDALVKIISKGVNGTPPNPDVVTLQEVVRYQEPKDNVIQELIDPIPGYEYCAFPLIDTNLHSSRGKWDKVLAGSDWPPKTFFAQGNAFLFRQGLPRFGIWDLPDLAQSSQGGPGRSCVEQVHLDSGLYFGDRDTEPRAALVAHFVCDPGVIMKDGVAQHMPLDIFVINLHLTTLMKEREGVLEIDARAARMRRTQLEIVFHGVVSRYNSWKRDKYPQRGKPRKPQPGESVQRYSPVWIVAGDFNFTEESEEYARIRRMNFMDAVIYKDSPFGIGTKAAGSRNDPTLNLDYIFVGPKFITFKPVIEHDGFLKKNNRVIHEHEIRVSDHYPLIATIPLNVSSLSDPN